MFSFSLTHAAPCGLSLSRPSIIARLNHRRTVARIGRLLTFLPAVKAFGRVALSIATLALWAVLLAPCFTEVL